MATNKKNLPAVSPDSELDFQRMLDQGEFIDSTEIIPTDGTQLNKKDLEGTPFFLVNWTFRQGTGPDGMYAFVRVMTEAGPGWFTDGSTGVRQQLEDLTEKVTGNSADLDEVYRAPKPVYFEKGLRASHYLYEGKEATTYYLVS